MTIDRDLGAAPDWPWPDALDAAVAAPESHEIVLENERVRVVRVRIAPGSREPVHTHRWPSVMIVDRPSRFRYYDGEGTLVFESAPDLGRAPHPPTWLGPEGPHAVENADEAPYEAWRIELKGGGREADR